MALLDRFRSVRPAWEHPDPALRAEAVRGLKAEDAALLVSIFRDDTDAGVRRAALRRIDDVAVLVEASGSDVDPGIREEAAAILLRLACESGDAAAAAAAAATVAEPRQLVVLARSARVPAVREQALARLADEKLVAVVAKTADDPRLRLLALERLHDAQLRADVALKSEHKDVATAALDGISDPLALAEIAEHARAKAAARRARSLLQAQTAAVPEAPQAAPAPAPESDETPEQRAEREAREAGVASRELLIERVASLAADAGGGLDDVLAAWARLAPLAGAAAGALQERFAKAVAAARDGALRREQEREARARADDEAQRKADAAQQKLERERLEKESQARLAELAARAQALARSEAPALKDAERAMREIRTALQDPGPLAGKREREALVEKLRQARAALYPRLQELREADEWKRWANTQVQEELVARMEALVQATDLDAAGRELHELNERWRQFSQARKEEAEALWLRFKSAREALLKRLDEHHKQRAAEEQQNLARKLELAAQAEALADSTDWLKTAEALQALQAQWKTIGPCARKDQKKVWERFHAACDRFFTARKQDLERRRDEWGKNLEKKEALIAQAEALAASSDWEPVAAEIRRLQTEWKATGPVKKSRSDAVWQRFKAACDAFFERYKRKDDITAEENAALRRALVEELSALAPAVPGAAAPDGLAASVQDVLDRWRDAPPVCGADAASLQEALHAARDRLIEAWPEAFRGSDLDPEANRARREKLIARVEALAQAHGGAAGKDSAASLAERLREAFATNAMGGRAVAEARWREAAHEIEQAQAAWKRLGPVAGEPGRELQARFKKACDQLLSQRPR